MKPSPKSQIRTAITPIQNSDDVNADYALSVLSTLLMDCFNKLPLYSKADFTRDIATVHRRIEREGFRFVTKTLPAIADGLLCQLETGVSSYPGFKTRANVPVFLQGIFRVALLSEHTELVKAQYIKALYQIGVSFKKFEGVIPEGADGRLFDQFVETDLELSTVFQSIMANKETSQILKLVRHYFRDFLKDIDPDDHPAMIPRPGPGATAIPVPHVLRYQPQVRYLTHDSVMPTYDWFYSHPWDAVMRAGTLRALPVSARPYAKYIVVPKTAEKGRGICSEMNEAQYLQQAVSRMLRYEIARHHELKVYLPLNDQSVNGDLAQRASLTKKDCTIDLSEASDRVIRDVISYVTQDNEEVHDVLMALATEYVRKSKGIPSDVKYVKLNKFAPMGSALCFPIMSLFNYFLCKAIIRRSGASFSKAARVFVFGDDIITSTKHFACLSELLPKFGLKLNQTKSYGNSYFRESCGVHAYYGINITPVYIRSAPVKDCPKLHSSVLANEELLFLKGYFNTAELLRLRLRDSGLRANYEVPIGSGLLGYRRKRRVLAPDWMSQLERATHTKLRIDDELQCFEYRIQVIQEDNMGYYNMSPEAALIRWFSTNAVDSRTIHDTLPYEDRHSVYRWQWVPESRLTEVTAN